MIWSLIGWRGIAGLVVAAALTLLLVIQKGETRHWRRQSGHYEQMVHSSEAALAGTIANYRAAAATARAADSANAARVAAAQHTINEGALYAFETRLAAGRARAAQSDPLRLRGEASFAAADPGARRTAPVPGLAAAPGGAAQAPGEDRLPPADALTATEQAIQLDELIKWVTRQHRVDGDAPPR